LLPILLAILSFVAAFVSRKEKNRLVPVILFLLPLLLGFFIYSMVGILVAAVEVVLFFSRKRELAAEAKKQDAPKPITYSRWGQVEEKPADSQSDIEEKPSGENPSSDKNEPTDEKPASKPNPRSYDDIDSEEPPPIQL